jgi:N-ethylmaleimide reductase
MKLENKMDTDKLFTRTRLGALELKNRIAMAPLTRNRSDEFGIPANFAAKYYSDRAGAGLIITEATSISFEAMGYPRTPGIHTREQFDAWKPIVESVHTYGAKIVCQLWHVGRIATDANRGERADVVAPSALRAPGQMFNDDKGLVEHDMPRALETEEISRIAGDFAIAARNAINVGFDGIELHSANGYLLHQFLSSNVNQRNDRFGGSIENRVRMPLEVLDAIVAEIGAERIGIRVSPGHTFNDIEETDMETLYAHYLPEIEKRGLAYLHVMRPFANTIDFDVAKMVRKYYSRQMIVCGGYDIKSGANAIEDGLAEVVAFGRLFIANPDLVERFRQGGPYNDPDESTFYTPGREGYTDYATLGG